MRALPSVHDVYFGVNLASRPAGRHSRGTVAALGCLYAEFDAKDFAGSKAAALAHVEALSPQPSAVVDSGGGYHAYWLLAERWELAGDAERERARRLQARWVERVGGDPGAKDLARVLRVPGTLNTKYDPPRPVDLLTLDDSWRYTVAELEALAPAPPPASPRPVRSAVRSSSGQGSPIERFNADHTVEGLLSGYGATRTRDGWACNCGVAHEHETQIAITAQGKAVFYSARCHWAPSHTDRNGRPIADAFALFAQVEHSGDKRAAVASLRPLRASARPAEDRPEADAAAHRTQEAARKRQARHAAASATLQAVRDRAAEDATLTPADRAVLRALLDVAGERDWCRPSKARLVELSGYSLGAVKRSLMRLEGLAYFASQGDGGGPNDTAIRTFLRGSSAEPAPDEMIHESKEQEFLESDPMQVRGGGGPADDGAPAPAELLAQVRAAARAAHRAERIGWRDLAQEFDLMSAEQLRGELARLDGLLGETLEPAEGASFTPRTDEQPDDTPRRRRLRDTAGLEWHLKQLRELDRYRAEQQGPASLVEAPAAEQPQVKGPPRAERTRHTYYALLGKAKNATSPAQRRYLRSQAAALEEWYTLAELQAAEQRPATPMRDGQAPRPPHPLPSPTQADMFAYGFGPPAPAAAPLALCTD